MSQSATSVPSELRDVSATPSLRAYLADLVRRREFIWSLATGNLRAQHLDTVLGNLWHVLNPVLLISVYYIVFGLILDTSRGVDNFIGFLAVGVFTYSLIQRTVLQCGNSIAGNIGLIRSLQFPRAVLPAATVLRELVGYGFAFAVMLVVLVATGEPLTASWLAAPLIIALASLFMAGLGMMVARVNDRVRDVNQALPYLFRIAFYFSGIIFSVQRFVPGEDLRRWLVLNPFLTYIDLLRHHTMETYTAEFFRLEWLFILVASPLFLVGGLLYFRAGERDYGRG